ncbi:uncharacterized protein LOC142978494 [Anticarsia gemmatalis]|uniref:uncharacterized protein LOC142978494 n=1 Tax=Anticarsia gemmatalis TaxID=129554 RepID=UPI003F768E57
MQVELYPENYQLGEKKVSPENTAPSKLDQAIKKIAEKEGFIKYKVDKKCVSTNGGNYLGELYEIDVKGKTKDGEKTLHIFVKNAIDADGSFKILSVSNVYNTENFAYKDLAKVFEELQDEANVPRDERYKMVKVYDETFADAIIMENVTKKGFTTYHRMDVMSLKFVQLAIQHLARFHGLSFVLKEKRPEYFNKKIKSLKYPVTFGEDWKIMAKSMKDSIMCHVDDKYADRIEKLYENVADKFAYNFNDESVQVCLCHGDYRPNNIMTKIEEDGDVTDLVPVDYQLIFYGCPIFDFLYLIYCCTDREFRKTHMTYLKDLYHDSLKTFLEYFNLDVNEVYPKEEFERVYTEKLDQGLYYSLIFLPWLFAAEDDVPDVTQEFSEMRIKIDDRVNDRLRGVIEEYVEWGYL